MTNTIKTALYREINLSQFGRTDMLGVHEDIFYVEPCCGSDVSLTDKPGRYSVCTVKVRSPLVMAGTPEERQREIYSAVIRTLLDDADVVAACRQSAAWSLRENTAREAKKAAGARIEEAKATLAKAESEFETAKNAVLSAAGQPPRYAFDDLGEVFKYKADGLSSGDVFDILTDFGNDNNVSEAKALIARVYG